MLKRIEIKGFKSLKTVEIEPATLTVLFGPNASGKSNFLDALSLLSKIATTNSLRDAFDASFRGRPIEAFSFPEAGSRDERKLSLSMEVDVELSDAIIKEINSEIDARRPQGVPDHDDGQAVDKDSSNTRVRERYLRYRIVVGANPKSGTLTVEDEYLAALNRDGTVRESRSPFLSHKDGRLRVRMERQSHPIYYDLSLDRAVLSTNLYTPHYPHMAAMRKELANWFVFYLEPREKMRLPNPIKEVLSIGTMGENLAAYFNTMKVNNPKQFEGIKKAVHVFIPSIDAVDVEISNLGEAELRIVESGRPISASLASEGTLRILGLMALTSSGRLPSLIGFEEPENGMHPRRIDLVARMLADTAKNNSCTIVVTTHSPRLLDTLASYNVTSLFVTKKECGETTIRKVKAGDFFTSSTISAGLDESENFSAADATISSRIVRGDFG